jgi:hypothetical protein
MSYSNEPLKDTATAEELRAKLHETNEALQVICRRLGIVAGEHRINFLLEYSKRHAVYPD